MFPKNIATHTFTWLSSHKFTHFLTYIRHYSQSAMNFFKHTDVNIMQRLSIQVQLQFFMIK